MRFALFPGKERLSKASGAKKKATGHPVRLRYSRFVQMMKVVLPSLAAALLSLVVIWPQLSSLDGGLALFSSGMGIKAADMLAIQNPHYYGTDNGNQPFSVTALVATQIDAENMVFSLEKPSADLSQKDGGSVIVNADAGLFRQKEDILDLMGGVSLYKSDGYEMHTESVSLNTKEGSGAGDDPVSGQGPGGEIAAEGIRLWDGGNRVMFTGKAKAILNASESKGEGQ
ncbi:hypothetical protein FACS1894205_5020 [Alphaproteobacteria bacterium]|nr:hypothetical protein FACS1894205_5020 [Alphaproteobacteria bacterium]